LQVVDLRVCYPTASVLRGVSFTIDRGEAVGLLGESGCGKSTTVLAVLGLLPPGSAVTGSLRLCDRELVGLPDEAMRRIRGAAISVILQEPRTALNPVMRVGTQVVEVIRAHFDWPAAHAAAEARAAMERVGLNARIFNSYPHQLSGGQLQRVLIAQALVCKPDFLLADEPTSALDSVTQLEILELLHRLKLDSALGMLIVTHHPAILNELAERVLVMYAGQIVESGTREQVYKRPLHPYTAALLRCDPPPPGIAGGRRLPAIPGDPPDFAHLPPGCTFGPRCPHKTEACDRPPELLRVDAAREVRCVLYGQ
jgi:peptide/nickel transport system ATP-binding protein